MSTQTQFLKPIYAALGCMLTVACAPTPVKQNAEIAERSAIAAASLEDAIVVDCQLPGKLQKLGGQRNYLTPGVLSRLSAVDCRARGGEYTLGDLASGTLSLKRWLPLAERGDAEAQYHVARIYANGMSGVDTDFALAAQWYQRAADQKFASAQQELGYMYERGLGVTQDLKLALNLQRQASGLGEELDYSSKIAAAQDEANRQILEMSTRLESSNNELEGLRAQLQSTTQSLSKSRGELGAAEDKVLKLRQQLTAARSAVEQAGDTAKVKKLEGLLAEYQASLGTAVTKVATLTAESQRQQTELASRLAESQNSTAELNQLVASVKQEKESLAARAIQAEQRLIQSRQELANLRSQYRAEAEQLTSERDALQRAGAGGKDQAQAVIAAKEQELERQQLRVQSLETELANVKKSQAATNTVSAAAKSDIARQLADMQARYEAQQRQLATARTELTALKATSQQDRTAMAAKLTAQLDARGAELETKQQRLASIEIETSRLLSELARLQAQRSGELVAANTRTAQAQQSLRELQRKLGDQQDLLDKLQTEKTTEIAALSTARENLQRQVDASRRANASELALLKTELTTRETVIQAKQDQIAALERQVAEQTKALSAMYAADTPQRDALMAANLTTGGAKFRSANAAATAPNNPLRYLNALPGGTAEGYHALVIGNSNYRRIQSLDTPRNDARDVADLLSQRYGYKVTLLLDATAEDIMKALHEKVITLTDADNLLVYYAGHGDIDNPPERAYWLGVDADRDTRVGWLSAENIRAKIKQMKAKHVLLVADSCFSGAITNPTTTTIGRGLTETRLRVQWNRRARMVLTSGQVTPVVDRAGDPNHSFFAKYFIQVLRQNEIILSGEMLSYEINGRMQMESASQGANGIKQAPTYSTLSDANHNFGDFFFVPTTATPRVAAL